MSFNSANNSDEITFPGINILEKCQEETKNGKMDNLL